MNRRTDALRIARNVATGTQTAVPANAVAEYFIRFLQKANTRRR